MIKLIATDMDGTLVNKYTSDSSEIDIPMAVLVDGNTASAAEVFTATMRDYGLAKIVGEKLGVTVEFVEIDWDNKIFELDGKAIDVVWNGMTLTDKVKEAMGCADPYCKNAQVVVVKADVADQYQDEASLADLAFALSISLQASPIRRTESCTAWP